MTPERWRRITEVFHLARARDVVARAALLDEACAGEAALRADVEEMLAADGEAGRFGDTPGLAVAEPTACLAPGAQFGLYRIDALIGSGGMGEVYRAHDGRLDRDVAIKLLSATTVRDSDARLRLLREARSAAALNHPHVCTIYEVGETDGHAYIAMELIAGNSLDKLIPSGGLPLEEILRYGLQIADALVHAHQRGIIHRDLKPANVMISASGVAKVLDFGLAKVLPLAEQSRLELTARHTAEGLVMGTAPYMSPEQALGRIIDERSDIFSFGGLLYEMASGNPAFNGVTAMEVVDAVLHAQPQGVSGVRRDLPADVSQVIQKALAKDPAERYQHMSELATALRRRVDAPIARASSPVPKNPVIRSVTAAAFAAAALLAAVVWIGVPAVRDTSVTGSPVTFADVTTGKTRVVVFPFENLTRQPDDDWLASVLSDSLTYGMQSLDNLLLVSRAGVAEAYREHSVREADRLDPNVVERLSRNLNVRYYVHGTYEKIGDQISVVARLMEIGTGEKAHETVTDRLDNLLQIEGALTRSFADSLESGNAPTRRRPETTSLAAYRAITEGRGLYAFGQWKAALEAFKRAVDLDPEYAEAWALLGKAYARLAAPATVAVGDPVEEYLSLAMAAARRAIHLDNSSYEAHLSLALAYRESAQIEPWRAAAQDAIALNPSFAEAYAALGDSYAEQPTGGCDRVRDTSRAVSYYRQALRIDPNVVSYYFNLAMHLRFAGRFDEALQVADEALRVFPTFRPIRRAKAIVLMELGRLDEAEDLLREAMANGAPRFDDHVHLAVIELKRGRPEAAAIGFQKIVPAWGHHIRMQIARHYFAAELPGPALAHLEARVRSEPACAQWLLTTESPYWAIIRANPQARALLARYDARAPSP
jgi:serine/threonine-protein kinase